ncbi:MAG: UPF0182 family protein, partial [Calditrichaceae bacterium]
MYIAIIIVLLGLASFIFISGINHRSAGRVVLGLIIGLFTISFFWFMGFWGELLWFQSIGYGDRFWIEIIAKFIITCVGLAPSSAVPERVNSKFANAPPARQWKIFIKSGNWPGFPRVDALSHS